MNRPKTNRRTFIAGTVAGVAGLPAVTTSAKDSAARITGVYPADAPAPELAFSAGIIAEGRKLLFISGRGPRDRKADMETQIRQTFESIGRVLDSAGATMKDIVILRAYFVNLARDLSAYRKVRKEFLSKPYPASTSIGVSALAAPDLQVEIEAVAVI